MPQSGFSQHVRIFLQIIVGFLNIGLYSQDDIYSEVTFRRTVTTISSLLTKKYIMYFYFPLFWFIYEEVKTFLWGLHVPARFRCLPSQKVMTYFARFARETTKEYNFIAVSCNTSGSSVTERKDLIHMITANGWREDGSIWHATSQCASSIYEATNHIWKNTTGGMCNLDVQ